MDGIQDIAAANQGAAPAPEPSSLSEAFAMYNKSLKEDPAVDVGGDEGAADGGEPGVPDAGGMPAEGGEPAPEGAPPQLGEAGAGDGDQVGGGPADVVQAIDYDPARQQILRNVQNQALAQTRQMFQEKGISPWTIEDLYVKDENTGEVTFRNPDNPDRPFQDRYAAQQFIDAMNKQITQTFRTEVNKAQQEILKGTAPTLRLLDFGPKYDAMDANTKKVFDTLAEPYAIKDKTGQIIGFNVDLDKLAGQAKQVAKMIPSQQPQQQQQQAEPAKTPPMDMKSGAGKAEDEVEPKSLGEALKLYDKKQREKKEGK